MLCPSNLVTGETFDSDGNLGVALYEAPEWWVRNRNLGIEITPLESHVLDLELEEMVPVSEVISVN